MKIYLIKFINNEGLTFLQGMTYDLDKLMKLLVNIKLFDSISYNLNNNYTLSIVPFYFEDIPKVFEYSLVKNFEMSNYWDGTYIHITDYYYDYYYNLLSNKHFVYKSIVFKVNEILSINVLEENGSNLYSIDKYLKEVIING